MTHTHTFSHDELSLVVNALREVATAHYRSSVLNANPDTYQQFVNLETFANILELPLRAVHDEPQLGDDVSEYADEPDTEPRGSHDMSDDGDALASAGHGTDEDYGGSHGGAL